jgi:hypothetical protein
MSFLLLSVFYLFLCFTSDSANSLSLQDELKKHYFLHGATSIPLPDAKERLYGSLKKVKSFYTKGYQQGKFECNYYDENGKMIRVEGGIKGESDTLQWHRLYDFNENEKIERYYVKGVLNEYHRWVYLRARGLIAQIDSSGEEKMDTIKLIRFKTKEGLVEETPYKMLNTFSDFYHYNNKGEIDFWGQYAFVKGSNEIVDFKSLRNSIKIKKKFDKNGCFCEQIKVSQPHKGSTKIQNDKFCNRIRFGKSSYFFTYEYDKKSNWVKKYEFSDENPNKIDTVSIEVREIEYYNPK